MFTNEEIKAILDCLEYTATHKYKKDNIAQCMLGELSVKVEECLGYEDDSPEWTAADDASLMNLVNFWKDVIEEQEDNNG